MNCKTCGRTKGEDPGDCFSEGGHSCTALQRRKLVEENLELRAAVEALKEKVRELSSVPND